MPLIVAALECNHHPNNGRISEYAPYNFTEPGFGSVIGRGDKTMDYLVNVFKPEIDRSFPTKSDRKHTFIAGSSMGGLMSLYALCRYGDVFSRAAALSPALEFGPAQLEELLRGAAFPRDTVLYMDMGERELGWRSTAKHFRRVCELLLEKRVRLTARIVPGGKHCEASWEKQIPFFLPTLLYGLED